MRNKSGFGNISGSRSDSNMYTRRDELPPLNDIDVTHHGPDQYTFYTGNTKPYMINRKKDPIENGGENDRQNGSPSESGFRKICRKHAEKTSLNGIPYIFHTSNRFSQIAWCSLLVIGVVMMVIHLMYLIDDYLQFEKFAAITWEKEDLAFPSITICNINPIKNSKKSQAQPNLQELIAKADPVELKKAIVNWTPESDGDTRKGSPFDDADYNISGIQRPGYNRDDVNTEDNDQWQQISEKSTWSELIELYLELYAAETAETREQMGHDLRDMVIQASFAGQIVNQRNFTLRPSLHYGNCYNLENDLFISTVSGPSGGLELILYLEAWDYLPGLTQGKGIKLLVQDKGTLGFPYDQGISINAGTHTTVALRQISFDRLEDPYSPGCTDQTGFGRGFKETLTYNRMTCERGCTENLIRSTCNCTEETAIEINSMLENPGLGPCRTEEEVTCLDKTESGITVTDDCDCGDPCTETTFDHTITSMQWPNEDYADVLIAAVVADNKKSPGAATLQAKLENLTTSNKQSEFIKLQIYFEDLNYQLNEEKEEYEDSQFYSDVGGTIGLWIGLSILGIFEVFHFLFDVIYYFIYGKKKKGKNIAAPPDDNRNVEEAAF